MEKRAAELEVLSRYLGGRQQAILEAWRKAASDDPAQTTVESLSRSQFNDHIPEVLAAFEGKLSSRPGGVKESLANDKIHREEVKHGLQRWQQGYSLLELMREWGHLHLCLTREVEDFASAHPQVGKDSIASANRQLIELVNEGMSESVGQYERMERAEAAGHVNDLELTISRVTILERKRAELIHQAVHDLRGNVQSVSSAAEVLRSSKIAEADRLELINLLQQGVEAVSSMLGELMVLARLEAGQEHRVVARFDAAQLVNELSGIVYPIASARGLYLKTEGSHALNVEGDAGKTRRLLQNLVLNALKYTERGGVTISWGEEKESWWVVIKDTGPGLLAGPGSPLAVGLKEATASARESEKKAAESEGETSGVLDQTQAGSPALSSHRHQPGEGIGLSIVKRLCELLDASLELISSGDTGTTFRVVFPKAYRPETKQQ